MEKERERNINMWLPLALPLLRNWPAIQACALLGIEPVTLWFTGRHSIHWATPAKARWYLKRLDVITKGGAIYSLLLTCQPINFTKSLNTRYMPGSVPASGKWGMSRTEALPPRGPSPAERSVYHFITALGEGSSPPAPPVSFTRLGSGPLQTSRIFRASRIVIRTADHKPFIF